MSEPSNSSGCLPLKIMQLTLENFCSQKCTNFQEASEGGGTGGSFPIQIIWFPIYCRFAQIQNKMPNIFPGFEKKMIYFWERRLPLCNRYIYFLSTFSSFDTSFPGSPSASARSQPRWRGKLKWQFIFIPSFSFPSSLPPSPMSASLAR